MSISQVLLTTLILTNDPREALALADHLAVMDLGRVVQSGTPSEVYNRPADAFVADPAQRLRQAVGMMLALGILGDLGAHYTVRVSLARRPTNPPDTVSVDALDLERAGARAIMRADAGDDVERQG